MTNPRIVFVLQLVALPGVDAMRALRHALKRLLRSYGLKCVDLHEEHEPNGKANDHHPEE